MIPELGFFALLLATVMAFLAGFRFILKDKQGFWIEDRALGRLLILQAGFVWFAMGCLTICFLADDFSVAYVLNNSSKALPWFYKACASFGGHEGSILLWVVILETWMLAVWCFGRSVEQDFLQRVVAVLSLLALGFLLFIVFTSNPFLRDFTQIASSGRDLNPLLQDPGFLFHPPTLYMGYVGLSVAFAFAVVSLWLGRVEANWTQWTRPWTLLSWAFLTLGITAGSWWAYRELGWGGWWFWDPVENASFMPWLTATALIHSLAVSERRGQFLAWTILLAITAFSLSLIGTFLVRSGVLTSVHAFAVDPLRGSYILGFLGVVIGGALSLYAYRASVFTTNTGYALFSKESALLLNNVFLVVAMLTVLLGTLYPLIIDALGLGKLSVGAPYFNAVFKQLMLPFFIIMSIGIFLPWNKSDPKAFRQKLGALSLILVLAYVLIRAFAPSVILGAVLGLGLGLALIGSVLLFAWQHYQKHRRLALVWWGMMLAHVGAGLSLIGMCLSSYYGTAMDIRMRPGQTEYIGQYALRLVKERRVQGANFDAIQAVVALRDKSDVRFIYPEKRWYQANAMPMTDSAIDVRLSRDVYLALGDKLDAQSWSMRVYIKPFIRFIWLGGLCVFLGALLSFTQFIPLFLGKKRRKVLVSGEAR